MQGTVSKINGGVALSIDTAEEMNNMSEDDFKQKMLETLWSFKNNKIYNDSLGADIEIRTSSIKKYKSFFADKNKRLIVPYIPDLLKKANFDKTEASYLQPKETNVRAYYKADIGINIDNELYNVHLTVKEDNHGHLFWDAQVQEKSPLAGPATNPGVKGQSDTSASDTLIIAQSKGNVKHLFQSAYAASRVDYDRPSLEYIGTGEGAQAHGWGLYYALNKAEAENYRKSFSMDDRNVTYKARKVREVNFVNKILSDCITILIPFQNFIHRVIHNYNYLYEIKREYKNTPIIKCRIISIMYSIKKKDCQIYKKIK